MRYNRKVFLLVIVIMVFIILRAIPILFPEVTAPPSIYHKVDDSDEFNVKNPPPFPENEKTIIPLDNVLRGKDSEIHDDIKYKMHKIVHNIEKKPDIDEYQYILNNISPKSNLTKNILDNIIHDLDIYKDNYYIIIRSEYILDVPDENYALQSEYGDNFYTILNPTIGEHAYLYNLDIKNDKSHKILTLVFENLDGEYYLFDMKLSSLKEHNKTFLEWFEQAKRLQEEGKSIPALINYKIALSCLPPYTFPKKPIQDQCTSLLNQIQSDLKEKYTLSYNRQNIYTAEFSFKVSPLNIEIFNILPEYWTDEDNFGYAIHYDSNEQPRVKGQGFRGVTDKEARLLHEYLIKNNILDKVGHYTYIPYLKRPRNLDEDYNQEEAVFIIP